MAGLDFSGRNIISITDFTREELEVVFDVADRMEGLAKKSSDILQGRIVATLFFEPSTRTRLSFESAVNRLGGRVIGFGTDKISSVAKGENLVDTIRTVENYADILVMRHPLEGAARLASEVSRLPVINAGSGSEEHPTQAMLDLYTIFREKGRIDNLEVAILGDLKYGRASASLALGLQKFKVKLFLVSHPILRMREEILTQLKEEIDVVETSELREVIPTVDVLYVTRIQKERFPDESEYLKVAGTYKVTLELLKNAKRDMIVMHPLPRVDEIDPAVDDLPNAVYFEETRYGVYLRMALLALISGFRA